jgi:hypothetical protein
MQPTNAPDIHMLISQHRDGRLIGSILRRFGAGSFMAHPAVTP